MEMWETQAGSPREKNVNFFVGLPLVGTPRHNDERWPCYDEPSDLSRFYPLAHARICDDDAARR